MWLHTRHGFYSAVYKEGSIQVRARVRDDLERLIATGFVPVDTKIIETSGGGKDYRYRIKLDHDQWAAAMGLLALDVDYGNFKSEVAKSLGPTRERPLHQIWSILGKLQPGGPYGWHEPKAKRRGRPAGTRAFADDVEFTSVPIDPDEDEYVAARLREAFSDDQLALIPAASPIKKRAKKKGGRKR